MKKIDNEVTNEVAEVLAAGKKERAKARSREEIKEALSVELIVNVKAAKSQADRYRMLSEAGFNVKEIAMILGVDPSAIRVALSYKPKTSTTKETKTVTSDDLSEALREDTVKGKITVLLNKKCYTNKAIATALALKPERVSMIKSDLELQAGRLI